MSIVYEWVKRESGENPERSRHCVRESVLIITEKKLVLNSECVKTYVEFIVNDKFF